MNMLPTPLHLLWGYSSQPQTKDPSCPHHLHHWPPLAPQHKKPSLISFHSQVLDAVSGHGPHSLSHQHPSFPFSWLPWQFSASPFPSQYPPHPFTPYITDNFGFLKQLLNFPDSAAGKESTCNAGDPDSIPGLGGSTGEGTGYPLQYSWASLVAQLVKNLPAMWETWI